MSLIPEKQINISPTLAATIGLRETIMLQLLQECKMHSSTQVHDDLQWTDVYLQQLSKLAESSLSEKIEMSKLSKNFIGVIINKNRINYLMDIINSFEKLMSGLKGEMSATITSAKVLKEEELKHIKDKLKDKFSSEFNINTIVDETLIGGLKIQVGSQMIDSSIKNQLQTLKEKMKEVA